MQVNIPNSFTSVDFSVPVDQLLCIEVFAGGAQLSNSLRQEGFSILPIDCAVGKTPKAKLLQLDLTRQAHCDILVHALSHANVAYCHCTPPCQTSLRAVHGPGLRSSQQPLGLPSLSPQDRSRVASANQLFFLILGVVYIAVRRGILVSVANPSRSYFWLAVAALSKQFPVLAAAWDSLESNHFQSCAHGGADSTWHCWYASANLLCPIRARCTHAHEGETCAPCLNATRAACPPLLCDRLATLIKQAAVDRGAVPTPECFPARPQPPPLRQRRQPPLVAEYKLITDACPAASCEYRLLRTLPVLKKGVIDGGFDDARGTQVDLSENFDPSQDVYGVFRTPAEFVKAALLAKHPIDAIPQIPDVLVRNVVRVLNDGPALTNAKRKLAVKKVQRLALSLQAGEVELHQSLNPEMQVVLKDKKLLLWKELMTLTDFHDKTLFDEVTKGFSLVGQAAFSEQFPHGFVPMQQTPQELRAKSIWLRKTAAAKCTASLKPDLDVQVWNQTLEECHKGWMRGPFTETRVTAMVGDPYWLATRRFALEQSDKIRLIDDGLASGLNSAFGTSNKLQLLDIDSLVSLLLRIQKLRLKASSGLCLSDGSTIQCHPSPAWEGNLELLGKTLDLKSAYKQLGPNMEDLWTRIIVVYDPHSQEPAYFVSSVLMFGSAASVYAFNRVSKSVWHITTSLLNLWQTVYYDDFPCIEPRATADCAHECVTQILDLLGWQYAKEGVKAQRFASCFNVLGVCVDLTQFDSGHILLRNKEAQVASLVGLVDQLLTDEKVPPGVAASLQGQLNFAQGQYMGSVLKPAMQFLGKIAAHGWHVSYKQELAVVGSYIATVLRCAKPRQISVHDSARPVLLFTDGAWEPDAASPAGAGVVCVDPLTNIRQVHEVVVPENLLRHWKSLGNKEQLIAELELFPIVVAFQQLQPLLQRRRVLLFVDNNAIKEAIVKSSSQSLSLFVLLAELSRLWGANECLCWVSRVPSKSNIADFPSRHRAEEAAKLINGSVGPALSAPHAFVEAVCSVSCFLDYMSLVARQFK